ncbi:MAG: AAA family ATPase, partial [Oscillospiraceae bacterium]
MKLLNLNITNFRNIKNINIDLNENINIFYGNNGQGKTNLVESIWLFSGFKSFRNNKDSELIKFDETFYKIKCQFKNDKTNTL